MTGTWKKPPSSGQWISVKMPDEVVYIKTSVNKGRVALLFDGSSYSYFSISFNRASSTFELGNCGLNDAQKLLFDSSHSSNLLSYTEKEWMIARQQDRLIIMCNGVKVKEFIYNSASSQCHNRYGGMQSNPSIAFNGDNSELYYIGPPYSGISNEEKFFLV